MLTFVGEVLLLELVLLDFKGVSEEGFSLLSSDGDVHGNLLVSFDGKTSALTAKSSTISIPFSNSALSAIETFPGY